jgi:DNA-binding XRE family transcriptional regulator
MTLAEYLKDWRSRHQMTQATAAEQLGIVLTTYRGLEQGRPTPYAQVIKMATQQWEANGGGLRMLIEAAKKRESR